MISKHVLKITFLNRSEVVFLQTVSFNFQQFAQSHWFKNISFCLYIVKCKNRSFSNNSVKHVNKVKWFHVLLFITNNSIKHQSFVYTQLNNQTVLFLTI